MTARRKTTQADCDRFMGAALERLEAKYPGFGAKVGADDPFSERLLDAMIGWMAESSERPVAGAGEGDGGGYVI